MQKDLGGVYERLPNGLQMPIFGLMLRSLEFCIPTKSTTVPDGPNWLHEVK
jgi:hypothetical protein